MNGSILLDAARARAVPNSSTVAGIDRFGKMSVAVGTAAAGRLAALQDSVARHVAAEPRAYYAGQPSIASAGAPPVAVSGYDVGRQVGAAAAAFLATETGREVFAKVLHAGEGIVRDLFGLGPANAPEIGAAGAEGAVQLALPLVA